MGFLLTIKNLAMQKNYFYYFLCAAAILIMSIACNRPDSIEANPPEVIPHYTAKEVATLQQYLNLPAQPFAYSFAPPPHMGTTATTEIDVAKATLGRVLFYDKALSADFSTSCASCHQQSLAFADDKAFSEGIQNRITSRNSIGLGSFVSVALYYPSSSNLFWDGRAHSFIEQMEETIANPNEMGMSMDAIIERLEEQPYYEILFKKAYNNSDKITAQRMMEAIAEFMFSIKSVNSKLDKALNFGGFTPTSDFSLDLQLLSAQENRGKKLFADNCYSCHRSSITFPSTSQLEHANNGLDMTYTDEGIGGVNSFGPHIGSFKIPSLRNIELTGPYMHVGRFETLEDVLDFYSNDIQNHENLDPRLKRHNEPIRFQFSEEDKADLLAFLKTLTDPTLLEDEKFSDPFFE